MDIEHDGGWDDAMDELRDAVFGRTSPLVDLCGPPRVAYPWDITLSTLARPTSPKGRQVEVAESWGDSVVTAGGTWEDTMALYPSDCANPWEPVRAEAALARKRDVAKRKSVASVLSNMGNYRGTLDFGGEDVISKIEGDMRSHADASGIEMTNGACSPRVPSMVVQNAARHGWCSPDHSIPHMSGTFHMPGGTGMEVVVDPAMSDDMVFFDRNYAMRRYEGEKVAEFRWRNGVLEIAVSDKYMIMGIKREMGTHSNTAMTFGTDISSGLAPSPASDDCPSTGNPGADAWPHRRLWGLAARDGPRLLGHCVREHGLEWAGSVSRWLAERTSGASVA